MPAGTRNCQSSLSGLTKPGKLNLKFIVQHLSNFMRAAVHSLLFIAVCGCDFKTIEGILCRGKFVWYIKSMKINLFAVRNNACTNATTLSKLILKNENLGDIQYMRVGTTNHERESSLPGRVRHL